MRRRKPTGHASSDSAGTAVWRDVAAALTPVIGTLGFDALFGRSLRAVGAQFPWLAEIDADDGDRVTAYEHALSQQDAAVAASAQAALLRAFSELLEHLVGAALAQRLLRERMKDLPPAGGHGSGA